MMYVDVATNPTFKPSLPRRSRLPHQQHPRRPPLSADNAVADLDSHLPQIAFPRMWRTRYRAAPDVLQWTCSRLTGQVAQKPFRCSTKFMLKSLLSSHAVACGSQSPDFEPADNHSRTFRHFKH